MKDRPGFKNQKQAIVKFAEHTGVPETGLYHYINKRGWLITCVDGLEYDDVSRQYRPIIWDDETKKEIYIPTKTAFPEEVRDRYKTEKQWKKLGYQVKKGEMPWQIIVNQFRSETTTDYYRPDQVEKI